MLAPLISFSAPSRIENWFGVNCVIGIWFLLIMEVRLMCEHLKRHHYAAFCETTMVSDAPASCYLSLGFSSNLYSEPALKVCKQHVLQP